MVCPVASSKTTPCSSCSYLEKIFKRWKEVDGNLKQREVRERVGGDVRLAPPPRGVNVFLELHPPFYFKDWLKMRLGHLCKKGQILR